MTNRTNTSQVPASRPGGLEAANLTLAFLLELALIYAVGAWGFHLAVATWIRYLLGVALPLTVVVIWARWLAPRAARRLSHGRLIIAKLVLFTLGAIALQASSGSVAAAVFEALALLNLALETAWRRQGSG